MNKALKKQTYTKRKYKEYILLTVCAAGFLSFTPFTVFRFIGQEWLLAVIDSILVITMFTAGILVWKKRKVRLASIILAFFCVSGMIAVIYIKGSSLIYWAYPTLATAFFLMNEREAIIIDLFAIAALAPVIHSNFSNMESASILTTMVLIIVFAYIFAVQTRQQRKQLERLATIDPLTGVGNRRGFNEKLKEVVAIRHRTGQPVSLVLLDIDHFKSINDTFGHETGDHILCEITDIIKKRIRITDGFYRIGGEEFVVTVMGADLSNSSRLADELRLLVEESLLLDDRSVTISLGVAEINEGETGEDCLKKADSALYESKRAGRNRISTAHGGLNNTHIQVQINNFYFPPVHDVDITKS